MNGSVFGDPVEFLMTVFFGMIYTFSGLYGSVWLFRYLDRQYDWLRDIWKRLIIGLIAVELWSAIVFLTLTPALLYWIKDASIPVIIMELKKNLLYPLVMAPSGMLLIAAVEFFEHWKASFRKQEKIKAQMMTYKYEALSNQLNPHFLFNSFNVLSSLVLESPELAIRFIDQLGDLYQRVLNNKDKGLIPLAEELDFVRSYIFLLKTRFEEKLDIRINIPVHGNEMIAPLVLQLLIENAVKHNIISKAEPLVIEIARRDDRIETRNPIRIKKIVNGSNATGLHNIQQRYSFFTDTPVEIARVDGDFVVSIPVLKNEMA